MEKPKKSLPQNDIITQTDANYF